MPSYPTDNPDPTIYDVPVPEGMTSPSKRPFETFSNLAVALHELENKATEAGLWDNLKWRLVLDEIDRAIVTERNEAYVRGMHDEHNEPLGDRLPPVPAKRD